MRRLLVVVVGAILLQTVARSDAAAQRTFAQSFGIEALGGTVGSATGLGLGLLISRPDACGTDDIGCILERLGASGIAAAAGSALGAWGAGRWKNTEPSAIGAVIGSIAGVAAGVGMLELLERPGSGGLDPVPAFVAFTVTNGMVTALFSRIGAAIRGD